MKSVGAEWLFTRENVHWAPPESADFCRLPVRGVSRPTRVSLDEVLQPQYSCRARTGEGKTFRRGEKARARRPDTLIYVPDRNPLLIRQSQRWATRTDSRRRSRRKPSSVVGLPQETFAVSFSGSPVLSTFHNSA